LSRARDALKKIRDEMKRRCVDRPIVADSGRDPLSLIELP